MQITPITILNTRRTEKSQPIKAAPGNYYKPSRAKASYSKEGQGYAKWGMQFYDESPYTPWEAMRTIFMKSLKAVDNCPEATQTEKSLAAMGLKSGSDLMTDKESVTIRAEVLKAIIGAAVGPVGAVIAQTALNSLSNTTFYNWGVPRNVERRAFDAIKENPQTSRDEKALAELGIDFGSDYMNEREAFRVRLPILGYLAHPQDKPMTSVLAGAVLKAAEAKDVTAATSRKIMEKGFEAVLKSPKANAEEKALAKAGIEAGADPKLSDKKAVQARKKILEELQKGE